MDDAAAASLVRMAFGYMPAQIVHAAAALGIPDLLGATTRGTPDLATATGAHEASLRRLLRSLAVLGLVTEAEPDHFALTAMGTALRADAAHSVRPLVMAYFDAAILRSWGDLPRVVRTGRPALEEVFAYLAGDPERHARFNAAMSAGTEAEAPLLTAALDYSRFATVVDVGGGSGTLLAAILNAHPGMRGVVFDTPAGVDGARETLSAAGVSDRSLVESGDFFESVPAGGDAYLLKSVLHDWDDGRCVTILRNCRRVMSTGDQLLVVEMLLPDRIGPDTDLFAVISDLNLMLLTPGRERTENEFRTLLDRAGFELVAVSGPAGRHWILRAEPRTC